MAEILVIDNNSCINELLKEILTGAGHQVTTAQSGSAAISLLEHKEFELAFIDLGLPDISGLAVLKKIKQLSKTTIPIVISGSSDFESVVSAMREKAFDYLLKPFDIDEVVRVANSAIVEHKKILDTKAARLDTKAARKVDTNKVQIPPTLKALAVILSVTGVGASFLAGIGIQSQVFNAGSGLPFSGIGQIIFLALSLCCCWAIMLLKEIDESILVATGKFIGHDALNLGIAYIVFAAILFFVFPLVNCRAAILIGYSIGLAEITLSREIIVPWLAKKIMTKREGNKHIVIVGIGKQAEQLAMRLQGQFGNMDVKTVSRLDLTRREQNNIPSYTSPIDNLETRDRDSNELYIDGNSLDGDELNSIVSNFKGKRVIINLIEETAKDKLHLTVV